MSICPVCTTEFEQVVRQKYCSTPCKYRAKDLTYAERIGWLCTVCQKPVALPQRRKVDWSKPPRHHECKQAHGTPQAYRRGCRCDACRLAHNAKMREIMPGIRLRHKERTGESYNKTRYRRYMEKYGVPHKYQWISDADRLSVYERDGWVCKICDEQLDLECDWNQEGAPTLDHILPRSLGGSHELENLRAAHRGCNSRRGNRV